VGVGGAQRRSSRRRDREFNCRTGEALGALLTRLRSIGDETSRILSSLTDHTVATYRSPQRYSIPFCLHYTAQHIALHLGQIIVIREYLSPGYRVEAALLNERSEPCTARMRAW
jgi:hypothetical protein